MKNEGGAPPAADIIGGRTMLGGGACEEAPPTFLLDDGFSTSTYFERTPLLPIACAGNKQMVYTALVKDADVLTNLSLQTLADTGESFCVVANNTVSSHS